MNPHRQAYLRAAESAAILLNLPAVAGAWDKPSALAEMTVGGLAAHLAGQVLLVPARLAAPPPEQPVLALGEHYSRVGWLREDLGGETNVAIRRAGEDSAAEGPEALLRQVRDALAVLAEALETADPDRAVLAPSGQWAVPLDDFLTTRMMEIAVHSDDLAVSVGIDAPELPAEVLTPVFGLLVDLSVRRHGATALLRALSRAERAPATIAGI